MYKVQIESVNGISHTYMPLYLGLVLIIVMFHDFCGILTAKMNLQTLCANGKYPIYSLCENT